MRCDKLTNPDYQFWDEVNEFPEWQVACLWMNIEPSDEAARGAKVQVVQQRLTAAREQDRLASTVKRIDFANGKSDYQVWYSREDLMKYAKLERLKPAFLYAEKRKGKSGEGRSGTYDAESKSVTEQKHQSAGMASTDSNYASPFLTVKQFAQKHPAYTEGALRNLIYRAEPTQSTRGEIPGNGMKIAIIRQGRKVLIDEGKFFDWLREGVEQ